MARSGHAWCGTPSSPTACSTDPGGADSSARRNRRAASSRWTAGTTVYILAVDESLAPHWLNLVFQDNTAYLAPAIRLTAVIALAWLSLSASWRWRPGPAARSAR